jgi:hypothetical protein
MSGSFLMFASALALGTNLGTTCALVVDLVVDFCED